jgi:AsmA protein
MAGPMTLRPRKPQWLRKRRSLDPDLRLDADLSQMALYGGSGTGKVALDRSVPALQASFDLDKVEAEPPLRDAMDMDRLSGLANGNVAVTAHGRSQRELVGSLGQGRSQLH